VEINMRWTFERWSTWRDKTMHRSDSWLLEKTDFPLAGKVMGNYWCNSYGFT